MSIVDQFLSMLESRAEKLIETIKFILPFVGGECNSEKGPPPSLNFKHLILRSLNLELKVIGKNLSQTLNASYSRVFSLLVQTTLFFWIVCGIFLNSTCLCIYAI